MSPIGHFDADGNACLKFHLCGVAHVEPGLEFSGIIDTGFTGFIQLPIQHAFSLKLPLDGTMTLILADGSSNVCLTALGRTTFDGETVVGVISLEPQSQDILIGMDFLRKFKKSVIIAKNSVVLMEEDWIEKAEEAAKLEQDEQKTLEPQPSLPPSQTEAPPGPTTTN